MNNYIGQLGAIMGRVNLGIVPGDVRAIARKIGTREIADAVEKAAVGANEIGIGIDSGTGSTLTAAIDQMRSRSFALMVASRAPAYPLHSGLLQLDEIAPTASEVDEMAEVPIDAVPHGVVMLSPAKLSYITVLSQELLASPFAAGVIQARAEDAVSRGLDAALLTRLPSSSGSISAGSDALADVQEMIGLINVTGSQPFVIGMAPDVALRAATLRQAGVLCFPGAVATGQSEIVGLPAIATDRITAGEMIVADPSGIAMNVGAIEVASSKTASLFMSDAGGSGAQQLVSMLQTGGVALRITLRFGMAIIRQQDVCGVLSGISWANS